MTPTILVIEDVPHVQLLIGEALKDLAGEVVRSPDGVDGWEKCRLLRPDLVVLDLALPGMSGWEVLQRIRADETMAPTPILVVTAHGQSGMAADARSGGADGFLEKPFRVSDLRDMATKLLEGAAA